MNFRTTTSIAVRALMAGAWFTLSAVQSVSAATDMQPAAQAVSGAPSQTETEHPAPLTGMEDGNLVQQFVQRYPGHFTSNEQADAALADAEVASRWQVRHKALDLNECLKRFFVTNCTDEVMARDRTERHQLRFVKVEANAFKRKDKAEVRDRNLAQNEQKREADAAQRLADEQEASRQRAQREQNAESGRKKNDVVAREQAARVREQQQRAASFAKSQQQTRAREAQRAANSAANQQNYNDKQAQSLARQRQLEEQRADSEETLAKKNAERAEQNKLLPGSAPPLKNADVPSPPSP